MSTVTTPAALTGSWEDAIPFGRLLSVELRKTYDAVAGFWLVASIVLVTVAIDGFVLVSTLVQDSDVHLADYTSLSLVATGVLLPVLGIMLVTSEWSQRTAIVTFSLEPRRGRVVLAKLAAGLVLTVGTVVAAVVVALVCTGVCELVQPDRTSWDLGAADVVGFLITQTLAMLGGFALAALLLSTPAAIVTYLVYSFALPGVLFAVSSQVSAFADVSPYLNFVEAQEPLSDLTLSGAHEWAELLVSGAVWLGLPLLLGLRRILRAEVK